MVGKGVLTGGTGGGSWERCLSDAELSGVELPGDAAAALLVGGSREAGSAAAGIGMED